MLNVFSIETQHQLLCVTICDQLRSKIGKQNLPFLLAGVVIRINNDIEKKNNEILHIQSCVAHENANLSQYYVC